MSYRCVRLFRSIISKDFPSKIFKFNEIPGTYQRLRILRAPYSSTTEAKELKTENNLVYLTDPDTFGTLSGKVPHNVSGDEGDLKEDKYNESIPLRKNQLSLGQYANLIKQYVKHKRIKEAIDVMEVQMKEARVTPNNYVYNILIGACAEVGYTKKAFKFYNDMKKRALKVTGDTYTCLFNACANSPWPADGIKNATHLRQLMKEKGIEPNLTNYNCMIKAFGRCGDLSTAFEIVDEMTSKKIKIRVHTFNFLLQACITNKENGLRHAIIVWRKMVTKREKPNIYSFNLMLKCVKDCNFSSLDDINETLEILGSTDLNVTIKKKLQITDSIKLNATTTETNEIDCDSNSGTLQFVSQNKLDIIKNKESLTKFVPNLLSIKTQINEVISIQEVRTPQQKFSFIGGQLGFLQEMKVYGVEPDNKTIVSMVALIEDTEEAEKELMNTIEEYGIRVDIDFYNALIKKRCFRFDYEGALAVKELIAEENKRRKKKHPMKKKIQLKYDLLTYGALAMTCKTKADAIKLIEEMNEEQIKINIEILGAMLSQAKNNVDLSHVKYVLDTVHKEALKPNDKFMNHLERLHANCEDKMAEKNTKPWKFLEHYKDFCLFYQDWIKEYDDDALKEKHPWKQFTENIPESVQRQNLIKVPQKYSKKIFKRPRPYKA